MNFAKALDKVPHRRLLYQLQYNGIQENTLLWIQAFLSDRIQTVLVNGISSDTSYIRCSPRVSYWDLSSFVFTLMTYQNTNHTIN